MTAWFAICSADGAVHGQGSCPDEAYLFQQTARPDGIVARVSQELHAAIEADMEGYRLLGGEVIPRDAMTVTISKTAIAADGEDLSEISGFPEGSTLTIRGAVSYGPAALVDPTVEISLGAPGRITVEITKPPTHTAWKATIDAA